VKTLDARSDWKTLLSYLPSDYERLAVEHRLLNAQWSNSKLKGADELLQLILLHAGADLPLRQTVATVAESGGPCVTQVYLHQKMRRAQPYLAALVERMTTETEREASPERWAGLEMLCLDGTVVCGPGAQGTDARIHAVLRLHDLRVCAVQVTDPRGGETLRRFTWMPGQLVIVDRGYSNARGVAHVVDDGAEVLVRLNRGALPLYELSGERIDILELCRALPGQRVLERSARMMRADGGPDGAAIDGRVVAVRLPEKEAEEARERVRREHGREASPEQLEAAGYVVLFTTTRASQLSPSRCIAAYRLRWQVELQFKRWKSLCNFDRLPNYRDDTIRSWLTAKVLLGLLLDRIGSAELASSRRPIARQPWKITAIVWTLIVGALMPLRLAHAEKKLGAIVDRLDAMDGDAALDRRQLQVFRRRIGAGDGHPRP
jgi:Transposase DDE domain